MKKEEALQQIQNLAAEGLVTKDEMLSAYDTGTNAGADDIVTLQTGISQILYYVGGAIVFLGIAVLIWQRWSTLNSATKIFATMGSGIAAYIAGVFLSRNERLEALSGAFYFISGLVCPLGLQITFDVAGFDVGTYGSQSLISSILLITYLLSFLIYRKALFIIFSTIFGTWLFFSFTSYLVGSNPSFGWEFYAYRVLCAGLVYGILGYGFSTTRYRSLTNILYNFGVFCFLGAALALGDWKPNQNLFWESIFPGLVFGIMFLSVHLKSKAFLTFGSIYLVGYIFKITAEYFRDSLGWPLILVLMGLGLIVIGYLHFRLKKRYLS